MLLDKTLEWLVFFYDWQEYLLFITVWNNYKKSNSENFTYAMISDAILSIHILWRYAYIPSFLKAQSCNLLSHLFIETSYHIFFALRNNKFHNSPRYVHVMCQHYDRSKQKKWKLFRRNCTLLTLVTTRSCHLWFSWLYFCSY